MDQDNSLLMMTQADPGRRRQHGRGRSLSRGGRLRSLTHDAHSSFPAPPAPTLLRRRSVSPDFAHTTFSAVQAATYRRQQQVTAI